MPYPLLWDLERVEHAHDHVVVDLPSLRDLPGWLELIDD